MPRYADPAACPDCGGPIGAGTPRCPACGLALTGRTAIELFWALQRADDLLTTLRAESGPAVPVASAVPSPTTAAPAPAVTPGTAPSAPPVSSAARSRLGAASVPRVLLGLGALCLVVAALVFMAVTWAHLGVGGRTLVLLAATVAAGAASTWTGRRSLPAASEALTVVTVALGALDGFGAVDAGWLGDLDGGATAVVVGLVVAAVSVALGVLHELGGRVGVAEQLLFALGCAAVGTGALLRTDRTSVVLGVSTGLQLGLAYAARRARLRPAALALLAVALVAGLALVLAGVQDLGTEPLTFSHTVLHGGSAELVAAAALALVAACLRDLPDRGRTTAAVLGLGLLALALTAFLLDEGPTGVGVTCAALAACAGACSVLATGVWRPALRLLALLATAVAVLVALDLATEGARRFLEAHRWLAEAATTPAADHTAPARWVALLVVPPLAALALTTAAAPSREWLRDRVRLVLAGVLGAAAVAGYAVAAVVPTPLVVLTAIGGVAALATAAASVRTGGRARLWAAGAAQVLGFVGVAVSYPSAALLLAGALAWAAACAVLVLVPLARPADEGGASGGGRGWSVGVSTAVWVLLAVPATLAVGDWTPPVTAAVVVAAAAVVIATAAAALLRSPATGEVSAGLAAAAAALSAGVATAAEPSGAASTWVALAAALGAATGARVMGAVSQTGAPAGPAGRATPAVASGPAADVRSFAAGTGSPGLVALVAAAGVALVLALVAAGPALAATVERVLADAAWSQSWRDRLPRLAALPSGVGATEQAALVGALVGALLTLLIVSGAPLAPGAAPGAVGWRERLIGVGWPALAAVLTALSWMYLPWRVLVVAAAVALAAATLLGLPRVTGAPAPRATAAVALTLLGSGTLAALPSQVLFVVASAAATAALAWLALRGHAGWAAPAAVLAGAGCLVSGALATDLPRAWSAAPVLALAAVAVVAGALLRRTWEAVEAAVTLAVAGAAVVAVADAGATALAAHLAVLGALAAGHGAAHPDRRRFAWAGSLLLAASTWVRLADADVTVVEAYTLPSALALLALGAWRLRTDPGVTSQRALGAGLVLATVPSLPQVWADPVSLRALLLGTACLALVLAGASLRLGAPLVVGAVVGAVVVLAEVWPTIGSGPQWVPLTAAGLLLLVCGATWEARVRDVRRAGAYLTALR